MTTAPFYPVLFAPDHWQVVDFISDLHLQATEPATFDSWQRYMERTTAQAVFILGDLFEVWVGDDDDTAFETSCVNILRQASQRLAVFIMHGNRDFLMGSALMARCGAKLLNDPTTLDFANQRWLLSHGDALCLGDTAYQQFRAQVRSVAWQQAFLAKPLHERKTIARELRQQSQAKKRTESYADVDTTAAIAGLQAAQATTLIHGHTHKPANHDLGDGLQRIVLSDWDASAQPARAQVLRLSTADKDNSVSLHRLSLQLI